MKNRYINKAHVKQFALDFAHKSGRKQFTRVGQSFFDDVEGVLIQAIRDRVQRHPSKGVTLQGK